METVHVYYLHLAQSALDRVGWRGQEAGAVVGQQAPVEGAALWLVETVAGHQGWWRGTGTGVRGTIVNIVDRACSKGGGKVFKGLDRPK